MGFSLPHILIFAVVAILLLGGGRFSNMMGNVAKGVKNFKKGMTEEDEITPVTPARPQLIEGKTAAEIIAERANPDAPNMGLTTWKGAKVRKPDVTVAKNYLNEDEMRQLNRIVTSYLDYAEDQAERRRVLYMADWRAKLDAFLVFNERDVLADAGKVSMAVAAQLATDRYDAFHAQRLAREAEVADTFDAETKQLTKAKKGNP